MAAIFSISQTAFAASSEDFALSNPACTINVSDNKTSRFINVNYIRVVQVTKDQRLLYISMASNYYNSDTDSFSITYPTAQEALKAMNALSDKINDCQYDAAIKRANKKKS